MTSATPRHCYNYRKRGKINIGPYPQARTIRLTMEFYTDAEYQKLITRPANAAAVNDAREHENRVAYHAKTVDGLGKVSPYHRKFLQWVEKGVKLQSGKYQSFVEFFQFPVATNSLVGEIYKELKRIFTASDADQEIFMLDAGMAQDYEAYLQTLNIRGHFETDGFDAFMKQPGSLYVVDMPAIQTTQRPEPYFYRVSIQDVIDLKTDGHKIEYVIYRAPGDRAVVIDAAAYRVFVRPDKSSDYVLESYEPHDLGYCPVTFLVTDPLYTPDDRSPIARRAIISGQMSNLDWLLFYKNAERQFETYGVFPIMTVPESDCSYVDAKTANSCQGGRVMTILDDGREMHYDCPSCAERSFVGPGTVFTKPVPKSKEQPELMEPVIITQADVPAAEHIAKKIDFLEWEIYEQCLGSRDEQATQEAVNEKQVQSSAEGKRATLIETKKHFEAAEKFIIDAIGRLRYGPYYVGCNVSYGENFILYTESDLITRFKEAKTSGAPIYIVNEKRAEIAQHLAGVNSQKARRLAILEDLEPWVNMSVAEVITAGMKDTYPEKFMLKIDFQKFVAKFERENGDLVSYRENLDYGAKITEIETKLYEYVEIETAKRVEPAQPTGGFDQ